MSEGEQPSYVAFFGVMGATAAMVFSGKNLEFVLGEVPCLIRHHR